MWWIIGIMICSIPILGIITEHLRSSASIKGKFIQDQLELEKMKHKNYLLETEKLRLELERMQLENSKEDVYKV
ncbi:hypothetical protein ACFFF5_17990 [Lederbergia wuyishanensis]|uniref:Uncharacterized protein n=1 Tax=Lederbergia wuyishanensis TaxID=1347903 RepID=A0ABU0D4P0_9BACI|nr:hypothetical protein [Lederbergia wuyishanensis]MCJ8008082.1 hypothetical protein [Lederbergia wuyishanensis]MDQ0343333.1 hypothetical protein [Lederbergia wuyishanensis]